MFCVLLYVRFLFFFRYLDFYVVIYWDIEVLWGYLESILWYGVEEIRYFLFFLVIFFIGLVVDWIGGLKKREVRRMRFT